MINFTKEHFERMNFLLLQMLLENRTISNNLGMQLNIIELLHTTTINTLNSIKKTLNKRIESLEIDDEWTATEETQKKLDSTKRDKDLVNLIIGYKRYLEEIQKKETKRKELEDKIALMKEEQKTPEEKLKEAEAELASIEVPQF